jgi:hypothetical protein
MITIASTANGVNVDFNGYFPIKVNTKNGYWAKGAIHRVLNHGTYIEIKSGDDSWLLNLDESDELFGVDSVDTVAPTDMDHLYTLLIGALS